MGYTTIIYKLPEKRRIWVSVILSIMEPGLSMVYCGRLWQGIIVEVLLIVVNFLLFVVLSFIHEFYMFLILVFVVISLAIGLLVYNIMLTIETNSQKIPRLKRTWGLIILIWVLSWSANAGLSIFRHGYLFEAYNMPSTSMEDALLVGDILFATKNIDPDDIHNGDLIVFKYPGDPRQNYSGKGTNWIKRVIATEGQTIKIVDKQVFVDGEPFDEPPTVKKDTARVVPYYKGLYEWGPYKRDNLPETLVPEGKLFVMGDNRDNSSDSRFWGYVDFEEVVGRPRFIHFSRDSGSGRVRLDRLGMRLDD
jgi:signal peptidase I